MNTSSTKKPGLDLGKLSSVAKIAVNKRPQPIDAEIELERIFSVGQVRKRFLNLEELAESFRLNGILEPLLLHEEPDGRYRVIVGERRLRAAPLAGLTKVPALIKRGLSELQIRRMQVSENNDREDLSAFEEAMGVIEDVERYGSREAMLIWNRGEAWISKRVAVNRYAEPVRALLEEDLCGDFEVLHCLKQIYDIEADHVEFERIRSRMLQGIPLSRDDARNTLARMKSWKQQQQEIEERRSKLEQVKPSRQASSSSKEQPKAKKRPENESKRAGKRLESLLNEVTQRGAGGEVRFSDMKAQMASLGHDLQHMDWVLWQGFLATTLFMLEGLGSERASAYLKKLLRELKDQSPMQLLQAVRAGKDEIPDGWKI